MLIDYLEVREKRNGSRQSGMHWETQNCRLALMHLPFLLRLLPRLIRSCKDIMLQSRKLMYRTIKVFFYSFSTWFQQFENVLQGARVPSSEWIWLMNQSMEPGATAARMINEYISDSKSYDEIVLAFGNTLIQSPRQNYSVTFRNCGK